MLNEILAKHFYVKNKRLVLLSPLFFLLVAQDKCPLKAWSLKALIGRIAAERVCVNFRTRSPLLPLFRS